MRRTARVLAATLVAGCAARGSPSPLAPQVRHLAAELDSAFASPAFDRAMWGVLVQSLDNGEVLHRRNAEKLFKPASNLKIVTGAAAQGNVHAKTGGISGARTLSGYVTTADGERLVFVLMCNHFTTTQRLVDGVQDLVVERPANFRRSPAGR